MYDKSKETRFSDVTREATEAVDAAVDFVLDEVASAKRWFRAKVGYQLHDPAQDVVVTTEPTLAAETEWVKEQVKAGLVEEVNAPAAPAAPAADAAA